MSEKKPTALIVPKPGKVSCLRCEKRFESPDKGGVRLCRWCRQRTPEDVWSGAVLPTTKPMLERNPIKAAVTVDRVHFNGDFHLPTLSIQIVDSVELVA